MRIIPGLALMIIITLIGTLIFSIIDNGLKESWFLIFILILIFLPMVFDKLPRRKEK